jgi:hypothetical protein
MNRSGTPAPDGIDIIEGAIFLLRGQPAGAWAVEAAGSIPLLLTALYFFLDMTGGRFDSSRCAVEAFVCAVAFLWFNVCRARFAQLLAGTLLDQAPGAWKQAFDPATLALQSGKLFVWPAAMAALLPIGWTVAFFRGNIALAGSGTMGSPVTRAARMAGQWPRQSWAIVVVLALFSAVVFLNLTILIVALPALVKAVSGTENAFTRLGVSLSGPMLAVAAGLAWLVLDPLYQAVYSVRVFLCESRETGRDLLSALGRVALVTALAAGIVPAARAQQAQPLTPKDLDAGIERVIHQPEYAWTRDVRQARDTTPVWFRDAVDWLQRTWRRLGRWFSELLDRLFRNDLPTPESSKRTLIPGPQWTLVLLLMAIAAATGFVAVRLTRSHRMAPGVAPGGGSSQAIVKLDDTGILPTDLPEEQWLELGRACLARGENRLAVRACYLANLAWLGRLGLLTLAPFKSNRDYGRELRRRTRDDALQQAFHATMRTFERGWYGLHTVDAAEANDFASESLRMRELRIHGQA